MRASSLYTAQLLTTLLTLFAPHAYAQDALTLQAAYHVIYSYNGTTVPPALLNLTSQGKVGGVILFGNNVDANLAQNVASLQSAYASSPGNCGKPLLIMTDQEGGEVRRLSGGPDLSEKEVGASSDPSSAATTAGQQAAAALAANSVNTNLAPVLGVYRTPGDFLDQYQRSYSMNATVVGECASAFVTAQQAAGVLATAKHFPGLGAALASQNTDERPVTINLTLSELRAVDEAPYTPTIAAGVKLVMASWALYPALDASRPAGLSSKWIQGELRGRHGFAGVTITDAIEAGALQAFGSDGNRAVLASAAGMDVILAAAQDESQGEAVLEAIVAALQNGTLDQGAFDAATQRIEDLRGSLAS